MNKTEKKGFYAELYNAQFLGMSIDDVEEEKNRQSTNTVSL